MCYNKSMIILSGNKIERSFAGEVLFNNINIQVDERDRIALVGKNGAGKSTLLKILVGEEAATSGDISTKRDLSLSYLAQDSRFESENTIAVLSQKIPFTTKCSMSLMICERRRNACGPWKNKWAVWQVVNLTSS